jgi:hypothetical protein
VAEKRTANRTRAEKQKPRDRVIYGGGGKNRMIPTRKSTKHRRETEQRQSGRWAARFALMGALQRAGEENWTPKSKTNQEQKSWWKKMPWRSTHEQRKTERVWRRRN